MPDSLEEQAALLGEKEAWAQKTAAIVSESTGIDLEVALAGARWASLWMDDFTILVEQSQPSSRDELRDALRAARNSSMGRSAGIPRYPTGVPVLRAFVAAERAFCLAFGDEEERKLVKALLSDE